MVEDTFAARAASKMQRAFRTRRQREWEPLPRPRNIFAHFAFHMYELVPGLLLIFNMYLDILAKQLFCSEYYEERGEKRQ